MFTIVFSSNARDNRDLNALNMFVQGRSQWAEELKQTTFNQMNWWSCLRESFATAIHQLVSANGAVDLIQTESAVEDVEKASKTEMPTSKDDPQATMIGARKPYSGRIEFLSLLGDTARTILNIKSG